MNLEQEKPKSLEKSPELTSFVDPNEVLSFQQQVAIRRPCEALNLSFV